MCLLRLPLDVGKAQLDPTNSYLRCVLSIKLNHGEVSLRLIRLQQINHALAESSAPCYPLVTLM